MKKTIKILVKKLEQDQNGNLTGGFSAVKGGFKNFNIAPDSENTNCTNRDCVDTTNHNPCTNTNAC